MFQNSIWYINHSFSIPLQRPNYFINSVDKTKVLHVRPHHRRDTTVLFLRNLTLPSKSVFIWYHTTYLSESKHAMRMKIFNLNVWIYSHRGGSRIFLGGGVLVSCSTWTPINHIVFFFCRIPVVLENRRLSHGGGAHPRHPPSRSAPETPPSFLCVLLFWLARR